MINEDNTFCNKTKEIPFLPACICANFKISPKINKCQSWVKLFILKIFTGYLKAIQIIEIPIKFFFYLKYLPENEKK